MENRAKDDYIANMRSENYELRQRERAFYALNERVSESEHRLHLVQDSRVRNFTFLNFFLLFYRQS